MGDRDTNGSYGVAHQKTYASVESDAVMLAILDATLDAEGYVLIPSGAYLEVGDEVCHKDEGWCVIKPSYAGTTVHVAWPLCRRVNSANTVFRFPSGLIETPEGELVDEEELERKKQMSFFFGPRWSPGNR